MGAKVLPPGTILQLWYLESRLREQYGKEANFLEIGSGNGFLSRRLLKMGYTGTGVDLNKSACENNAQLNSDYIVEGKYNFIHGDFTGLEYDKKYDFILAMLVIEHIPHDNVDEFVIAAKQMLKPNGRFIIFVPGSKKHWGIEDDIAGHIMRYEQDDIEKLAERTQLKVAHSAGLTYPLSNWLLSLSNKIVKNAESDKLELSAKERTVYTGNRNVNFKTTFPPIFGLILNRLVLSPFYFLQHLGRRNKNCLIMYSEFSSND